MYGSVQLANLVEKHGAEAIVGAQFEKLATQLIESDDAVGKQVAFEWFGTFEIALFFLESGRRAARQLFERGRAMFECPVNERTMNFRSSNYSLSPRSLFSMHTDLSIDFHAACRGMKFENVSLLLDIIGKKLDQFGYTVELDSAHVAKQQGVLRTNCMDCLDRTNVVQSACGRRALELQLKEEGIDMSIQPDQITSWFNTLWADNGDAVSSQYASTAAMKGDFTRTRKRNFQGALKDMGISISRFYSGRVQF